MRVATATKGRGEFDREFWVLFTLAGAAHTGDAITTWDAVAEGRGIEGNPLLADRTGHPKFGAIIGGKSAVLALAVLTRRKWPNFSRWLLVGSLTSAGAAAALNTTVGKGE